MLPSLPPQYIRDRRYRSGRESCGIVAGARYTTFKAKRKMFVNSNLRCIYGLCVEIKLPKFDT